MPNRRETGGGTDQGWQVINILSFLKNQLCRSISEIVEKFHKILGRPFRYVFFAIMILKRL
jgi:hypothetical protein